MLEHLKILKSNFMVTISLLFGDHLEQLQREVKINSQNCGQVSLINRIEIALCVRSIC